MRGNVISLLAGCLIGGVAIAVFGPKPEESTPRAEREEADPGQARMIEEQSARLDELRNELAETKAELVREKSAREELEKAAKQESKTETADPGKPVTDEELQAAVRKFAGALQGIILGSDDGKATAELRALLKRAGPEAIEKLKKRFEDSSVGLESRMIVAHALGQSGDPKAIEALAAKLRDPDADLFEKRLASHALAFSDADDITPLLTVTARNAEDPGARANSAFGLIKREVDEGYQLYAEATDMAFEQNQPEAIAYLQGFFLMDDEKGLPHVRERLTTYESETALLLLIEIVKAKKDKGAIEQLKKLAYDSSKPKSVQNAAQGTLKALGGE